MNDDTPLLFADFLLDPRDRALVRDGQPVELSSRYFDALVLLVRERGALVSKQRFMDEVWGDTVVTDASLTQCIKDIRRALGDDAANPRFVRTVPGHGYRFVAPVQEATRSDPGTAKPADRRSPPPATVDKPFSRFISDGLAGTAGGGLAGILVGLLYGSALAASPASAGLGIATMVVVLALNGIAGLAGGFGVSVGIAAGRLAGDHPAWTVAGAAGSGFMIGGVMNLVGSDAFVLLFGHAPEGITGGFEGTVLGIAIAAGALLAGSLDATARWRPVLGAAAAAGCAGAVLTWGGGRMMAGSLERLSGAFADSRLDLASLGRLFGEARFGTTTHVALGAIEGVLFGACVAAALVAARRAQARPSPSPALHAST